MPYVYNPFINNLDNTGTGGGGGGDVSGPGSSTDNAVVRWDGTTGTTIQNSTVIMDDTGNMSAVGNITVVNGSALRTGVTAADTLLLQARDVDGAAYTTFATLTANNTPTMDLSDSVTKAGGYIYRAGGTDVAVADGGTNLSSYTTGDLLYASGATTISKLAVGTGTQVLGVSGGLPAWVAAATGTVTSVSGTANRISSTGGATPVIDIDAAYVGQSSITTLGTITTGVWHGTAVAETFGGTNQTSYTTGDILYSSATNTLSKLSVPSSAGDALIYNGTNVSWRDIGLDVFQQSDFITNDVNFTSSLVGTGSSAVYANINGNGMDQNHPGVLALVTGTTTTGSSGINTAAAAGIIFLGGGGCGTITIIWVAKLDTLSDGTDTYTATIGITNSFNATVQSGCYFQYTNGVNSGAWTINTASNSSITSANTANTADTGYHQFKIVINNASTSVAFFIDNVQVTGSPLTTNIPTTTNNNTYRISPSLSITKSAGTTSRTLYADAYSLYIRLKNAR